MKKIIAISVISLIIITGCEKIHRYHYTGKWNFEVIYTSGNIGDGWKSDTTYYSGKISIAAAYNKLKIEYLKDTKITMDVDEDGGLSKDFEDHYEFAYGQFYGNNHVEIRLGWRALGGGYYYTIIGTKKK
jgi:hypothetical protein